MRYFIDTEFDGYQGPLISMAIIREDNRSIYFVVSGKDDPAAIADPWVAENVLPILRDCPEPPHVVTIKEAASLVRSLLKGDEGPHIVSDWPDDLRHLCDVLVFGPGEMIDIPGLTMEVRRVDAYPTDLPSAVQHNAWWDALALKHLVESEGQPEGPDAKPYKPGDLAIMKGGGPVLTVTDDERPDGVVDFAWFDVNGSLVTDAMPRVCLNRYQ